jgi:hypothetical protein
MCTLKEVGGEKQWHCAVSKSYLHKFNMKYCYEIYYTMTDMLGRLLLSWLSVLSKWYGNDVNLVKSPWWETTILIYYVIWRMAQKSRNSGHVSHLASRQEHEKSVYFFFWEIWTFNKWIRIFYNKKEKEFETWTTLVKLNLWKWEKLNLSGFWESLRALRWYGEHGLSKAKM